MRGWLLRFDRQKGVERFRRSVRQTGQGVAQVDPGIDPKLLTGGGEAGQDGQGISALVRAS